MNHTQNPVDWDALTTEQKNRLIHVEAMDNPEFCPGQLTTKKRDHPSRTPGVIAWSDWYTTCSDCKFTWTTIDTREWPIPERHATVEEIPDYCTDLNDAWLVVEKMMQIPTTPDKTASSWHMSRFAHWFHHASLYAMAASEVADAICRAALQIMGVVE